MNTPTYKFTNDGKKVLVVGKLNAQETIVQEVFVMNENEIPSGEKFVVKSLHDAPAISWKEKNLKELEVTYDKKVKEYDKLDRDLRDRQKTVRQKFEQVGQILKNVNPTVFETLVAYIGGEIKWIVETQYSPKLIEFKDFQETREKELRLISIFGSSNGDLTYAIGSYSDYSGGKSNFKPFVKYEDALAFYANLLCNSTINEETIKNAKKHNIELPQDKVSEYYAKTKEGLLKNIENYKKDIAKWELMISENELKSL